MYFVLFSVNLSYNFTKIVRDSLGVNSIYVNLYLFTLLKGFVRSFGQFDKFIFKYSILWEFATIDNEIWCLYVSYEMMYSNIMSGNE